MTISWLHLSDLHACRRDAWDSAQITDALVQDLEKLRRERDLVPDLIFFTGDAAWGHLGSMPIAEQFEQAFAFLENVRKIYGDHVPLENVFLVPGNHDVDRGRATKLAKAFLENAKLDEITTMVRDAGEDWRDIVKRLDPYRDFVVKRFPHLLPDDDARKRLIAGHTREVGGKKVGIALFNTAWSCSGDQEKGRLWLAGDFQRGHLRPFVKDAQIKIALLHHPPNWFGEAEDPKFGRKLQEDFHFALHGHEHDDWVGVDDRGKVRVGAGACYARRDCGENVGYALTRLVPEEARVEVHQRSWGDESGWVARLKNADTDDSGVRHAELLWLTGTSRRPKPKPGEGSSPAAPAPGARRVHDKTGIELVWVQPGRYRQGGDTRDDERPIHAVELNGFWIGRFPVINEQIWRFLVETGGRQPGWIATKNFGGEDQPVVGLDWFEAQAFCLWAELDLPSEAQWEAAARGKDLREFPWGNETPTSQRANFDDKVGHSSSVGAYSEGAGPFGALDQAGNVWEWCRDVWDANAYQNRQNRALKDPCCQGADDAYRVVRGGSWTNRAGFLRAAFRRRCRPSVRDSLLGFRVVLVSAPEHV